jgi:hypothetical protein
VQIAARLYTQKSENAALGTVNELSQHPHALFSFVHNLLKKRTACVSYCVGLAVIY